MRLYPRASSSANATPQSEAPTTTIFESTILPSIMDNLGVVRKREKDSVFFLGFLSVSTKLWYRYFILRRGYTGIITVKHIGRGCVRVWKRWYFPFYSSRTSSDFIEISFFFFLPDCSTTSPRADSRRRKSRWAVKSRWKCTVCEWRRSALGWSGGYGRKRWAEYFVSLCNPRCDNVAWCTWSRPQRWFIEFHSTRYSTVLEDLKKKISTKSLPNNYNTDDLVVPLEDVGIRVRMFLNRRFIEIPQNVLRFSNPF